MDNNNLNIDKNQILRYLGYRGQEISNEIQSLIEECIKEIKTLVSLRNTYKYSKVEINNQVNLIDIDLKLEGKDIIRHLEKSNKCCVMAATLGSEVDRKILYYEKVNMTKAVILDACATTAIEEYCDLIENEIKKEAVEDELNINWRYSPGYGDLDIFIQRNLLKSLDAEKIIGLTVSSHNILIPRKSVTAIIGIIPKEVIVKKKSCNQCNKFDSCKFRKIGEVCEY
ncbi:methionine synthase [Clostridium botulinum]|uniref:methionine synthase n=1 Tax=Clostridium TaxID=1485 RepID=UPI001A92F0D0|nr:MULTISPECIES: methionine synthase [Clostridium]MBO0523976.1 methionine synthase [Clostridium botulinum]MBO0528959.1 methionine synthase [Clostridium botulinum]MBO0530773.1 methionine synthase [Clostridium botulinum]MBO0534890.1 methionine synthase [Clostridium botulinum]MBO0540604.1 methionine synthase [Clostridium botulinum]